MYLPFIPEEFEVFQALADDHGWRGGHAHGNWFQHLGVNYWTEHFGAYRPLLGEDGRIVAWEELETWWKFTRRAHNPFPASRAPHPRRCERACYILERESYKRTLIDPTRVDPGEVFQEFRPESREEWAALFRA